MKTALHAPGSTAGPPAWLVVLQQIPATPHYLRVKIGRRLHELGAVGIKNSVYVLPNDAAARDAVHKLVREIHERGGQAVACEAHFVAGLSDETARDLFRRALDREYAVIGDAAKALALGLRRKGGPTDAQRRAMAPRLRRLKREFQSVVERDRFGAAGRETASGLLSLAEDRLEGVDLAGDPTPGIALPPKGATWTTRAGVRVDRIACAWLIRRFIDPGARFRFVTGRARKPVRGEVRFDMPGAEFTHVGDACTFEVLLDRFRLRDSSLRCIAELVHDLDLEDGRFGRPETAGLGRMIVGIALSTLDDATRIAQGSTVFDGLYASFRRQSR